MSELSKQLRELARNATPRPWAHLKWQFKRAMDAFKKRNGSWWHGTREKSYPVELIAHARHYGEEITEEQLSRGCPDWWDLKKVIGYRWSAFPKRTKEISEGFFSDADAAFIVGACNGVESLCDEIEAAEKEIERLRAQRDAITLEWFSHDQALTCEYGGGEDLKDPAAAANRSLAHHGLRVDGQTVVEIEQHRKAVEG